MKKLRNMRMVLIAMLSSALRTIYKGFDKTKEKMEIGGRNKTIYLSIYLVCHI